MYLALVRLGAKDVPQGSISFIFMQFLAKILPNKNAVQSNANHPLADSMGYINLDGKKIFLF